MASKNPNDDELQREIDSGASTAMDKEFSESKADEGESSKLVIEFQQKVQISATTSTEPTGTDGPSTTGAKPKLKLSLNLAEENLSKLPIDLQQTAQQISRPHSNLDIVTSTDSPAETDAKSEQQISFSDEGKSAVEPATELRKKIQISTAPRASSDSDISPLKSRKYASKDSHFVPSARPKKKVSFSGNGVLAAHATDRQNSNRGSYFSPPKATKAIAIRQSDKRGSKRKEPSSPEKDEMTNLILFLHKIQADRNNLADLNTQSLSKPKKDVGKDYPVVVGAKLKSKPRVEEGVDSQGTSNKDIPKRPTSLFENTQMKSKIMTTPTDISQPPILPATCEKKMVCLRLSDPPQRSPSKLQPKQLAPFTIATSPDKPQSTKDEDKPVEDGSSTRSGRRSSRKTFPGKRVTFYDEYLQFASYSADDCPCSSTSHSKSKVASKVNFFEVFTKGSSGTENRVEPLQSVGSSISRTQYLSGNRGAKKEGKFEPKNETTSKYRTDNLAEYFERRTEWLLRDHLSELSPLTSDSSTSTDEESDSTYEYSERDKQAGGGEVVGEIEVVLVNTDPKYEIAQYEKENNLVEADVFEIPRIGKTTPVQIPVSDSSGNKEPPQQNVSGSKDVGDCISGLPSVLVTDDIPGDIWSKLRKCSSEDSDHVDKCIFYDLPRQSLPFISQDDNAEVDGEETKEARPDSKDSSDSKK